MSTNKNNKNELIKNEVLKELKEGAENLDIINIDVNGLVSMINENNIGMYDDADYNIYDVINDIIEKNNSLNSFFLMDIGAVIRRYKLWMTNLPNVKIFYAVKCNSDKLLLRTLVDLGVGFDVASKAEISVIKSFGVDSNKIIFANPVKEIDHITFAKQKNIKKMTFDSEDELLKIKLFHPGAELVLRILVDDSKSICRFGSKFGCPKENLERMFTLAKVHELNINGVSFHVGSGCEDPSAYSSAILSAREVFDLAKSFDFNMTLLDIGGGFPGHDTEESDAKFINIANTIKESLTKYFSDIQNLEVIAEPGRFFATSCGTLVTNVIGRKVLPGGEAGKTIHYYINSNLYGLFNNIIFDHATPLIEINKDKDLSSNIQFYKSTIFGQTCDSLDKIAEGIMLPELSLGNWLIIKNHGAYTIAAASRFNGFDLADIKYVFTY